MYLKDTSICREILGVTRKSLSATDSCGYTQSLDPPPFDMNGVKRPGIVPLVSHHALCPQCTLRPARARPSRQYRLLSCFSSSLLSHANRLGETGKTCIAYLKHRPTEGNSNRQSLPCDPGVSIVARRVTDSLLGEQLASKRPPL